MSDRDQHDHVHDLVGASSWSARWRTTRPRSYKRWNYYHQQQNRYLRSFLPPKGGRFLELGCAHSLWISELGKDHEVWGIDYSEIGLQSLRARAGVTRERILLGDVFDSQNGAPRSYFDVVFSDGLLEHFGDGREAARAFAQYVRPGGVVVTSVPNMRGAIGRLHRWIAPAFFTEHVAFSPSELDATHIAAGLEIADHARYWGHFSLGVVNYERVFRRVPAPVSAGGFWMLLATQQIIAWTLAAIRMPESVTLSPYIRGTYRRRRE